MHERIHAIFKSVIAPKVLINELARTGSTRKGEKVLQKDF
jgi:hypothetical protein